MEPITSYIKAHSNGKDHPVPGNQIARAFGITGVRVREQINDARSLGDPICASHRGYYIAASMDDLNKTIDSMLGRIEGINRAVAGLQKCVL